MSKQVVDPVEEPELDEGEESDEYDIEEEEGESGVFEGEDEEGDEEGEGASGQGSSLTALLLGGEGAVAEGENEEEEDEDEEYQDGDNAVDIPPATVAPTAGTKRGREDDEPSSENNISGDYGELQEAEEGIAKRARTAADAELEAAEDDEEEV
ncbi:hypothetical protein C8Q79DRAFT_938842 [Trametes meyenii]|nr:hypothetical protein C8Q79DRAFT_938842 [Trametes meyenii]